LIRRQVGLIFSARREEMVVQVDFTQSRRAEKKKQEDSWSCPERNNPQGGGEQLLLCGEAKSQGNAGKSLRLRRVGIKMGGRASGRGKT